MAYLTALFVLLFSFQVNASDIEAIQPIKTGEDAKNVCEATCEQQACGWSGEWKRATADKNAQCDCGPVRTIKIPGGVIRSQEQAVKACTEICTLNDSPWTGEWEHVPGAFDVCGCKKIGDWCEPKKKLK